MDFDIVNDFEDNPGFRLGWHRLFLNDATIRLKVCSDGVEVARADLLTEFPDFIGHYPGAPADLAKSGLYITLIEVAESRRGERIGTRFVHWLSQAYPNRRPFGLSTPEAEGFWSDQLGWERFEHVEGTERRRVLYVEPNR